MSYQRDNRLCLENDATRLDIVDESDIWLATLDEPGEAKGPEPGAKP